MRNKGNTKHKNHNVTHFFSSPPNRTIYPGGRRPDERLIIKGLVNEAKEVAVNLPAFAGIDDSLQEIIQTISLHANDLLVEPATVSTAEDN